MVGQSFTTNTLPPTKYFCWVSGGRGHLPALENIGERGDGGTSMGAFICYVTLFYLSVHSSLEFSQFTLASKISYVKTTNCYHNKQIFLVPD